MPVKKKTQSSARTSGTAARASSARAKSRTGAKAAAAPKSGPKARTAAKPAGAAKPQAKPAARSSKPAAKAAARPAKPPIAPATAAGRAVPDVPLRDQAGRTVRLSDFLGRKVLVYFYPKADTPGCTVQACSVRDARRDLAGAGLTVLGVSPDAPAALERFDRKHGLGFTLLSDPDHALADWFGAWGEKSLYGRKYQGVIRSAFLVDERGRLARSWPAIKPAEMVPEALGAS